MKHKQKNLWRLWCYSLGEKQGKDNKEADTVAFIRTLLILQAVVCNGFIIFGVLKTHVLPKQIPPCTTLQTVQCR